MKESAFQFSNPELEDIVFHVNPEFDSDLFDNICVESETKVKLLSKNEANVRLIVNVGEKSEKQPFNISVTMGAKFIWNEKIHDDVLQSLLKINAPTVLLSYIRPIIASLTSSSCYPTLNLPFIDMTQNEINDFE